MTFAACSLAALLLAGAPAARPEAAREQTIQKVRFLRLFLNGAGEASPLIVAIHGRGSSPEKFAEVWRGFPGQVELALPQAPLKFNAGWSWFDWPPAVSDDTLAAMVAAEEERLWPAIAELAQGRKAIVMGFSQGGVLSYVLAARHPGQLAASFPIAGLAPKKLLPKQGARSAPVFALHGSADPLIRIEQGQATVAGFKQAGSPAQLREYPGVGHTITQKMRAELFERVLEVLKHRPQ